eukprot:221807_1
MIHCKSDHAHLVPSCMPNQSIMNTYTIIIIQFMALSRSLSKLNKTMMKSFVLFLSIIIQFSNIAVNASYARTREHLLSSRGNMYAPEGRDVRHTITTTRLERRRARPTTVHAEMLKSQRLPPPARLGSRRSPEQRSRPQALMQTIADLENNLGNLMLEMAQIMDGWQLVKKTFNVF